MNPYGLKELKMYRVRCLRQYVTSHIPRLASLLLGVTTFVSALFRINFVKLKVVPVYAMKLHGGVEV